MSGTSRHNKDRPVDISRPAVLYVEKVETNPHVAEYFESRRLAVIDIEIDPIQAVQIIEHIRERNSQGLTGAIRIRFTGRLIHL